MTTGLIAKIRENYFLDIANGSKFVKYRALENNQLYGMLPYVRQALGPITPHASTNAAESVIFENYFYWERNSGKKDRLLWSGFEPGLIY